MAKVFSQEASNAEQFAMELMALPGTEGFDRMLSNQGRYVDQAVIRRLKDEVAYFIRADIRRAVELAETTREVATFCEDPVGRALAHHASALANHFSGRYTEAIECYEEAKGIYSGLGEEVDAARITRAEVDALMYLGEYDKALQLAITARQVFQRHGQGVLAAQVEEILGNLHHRRDEYREALTCYDRAREMYAAHQDDRGLASISFNAANQYTQLNDFEKALGLYEQARQGYEKLEMPLLVNQTEYSVAWLYFLRGRFQESLKLFPKVQAKAKELGDASLDALCDLDLAEVYLQLNTYEDALNSARSAAQKFTELKRNYENAKAKMYLGIAETHMNDLTSAEASLEEARQGFLAEGNEIYTALADIYLSDVLTHRQEWERALRLCAEAKKIFGEQHLSAKEAYAELQLARLRLYLGDSETAGALCRSALELIGEAEAPWLKYQCLHLLGNTKREAGQEQEAYQHYTQAIEYLETLRSSIRVDEYKCTFLKDKLRVYEDVVELCLSAGTNEKVEEAFEYVEAAKSRSLVELLSVGRGVAPKTTDPSVEQLHRQWNRVREELDWYYNRNNQFESQSNQRPAWLGAQIQTEVRDRERELAQLARRLRLEDVEYSSLHTSSQMGCWEVRECLAQDEVLLEYYVVNDRVKVFEVCREGVRIFNDISTVEAIAPLIRRLKFYLEKFTLSERYTEIHEEHLESFTRLYLEKLYDALMRPIEHMLDGKKLIVVPHGFLHYVPFHALYDGKQYLIDRHEISYCPSATAYKLCVEKAKGQPANGRVVIMGVSDEATPFIREEVATVQSMWDGAEVLVGEHATLDELKRWAPECRLLHLASHGVFRRDNPMFSALKLGDGWLNFYDIFNLNLNAQLVTLSACETGMNEVFPGDELFGLMRGFLYAGAPSLILSLWVVNDRSTAEFMRSFYAGLSGGLSKRTALRQAQLAVKEQYRHPFYWAPFILMGAPV